MFPEKDIVQMQNRGTTTQTVVRQMANFRNGFPFLKIDRAATAGDGIRYLNKAEIEHYASLYRTLKAGLSIVKFVPASGAATRMFKELFDFVNEGKSGKNVEEVVRYIDRFAFGKQVRELTHNSSDPRSILSAVIRSEGLNYGKAPKAWILFHRYADGDRTALEEHLVEGALYAASSDGTVDIHFTVSPEHRTGFETLVREKAPRYEQKFGVKYRITYSQQDPATDTLAVTPDNEPFREADGSLLFRPAGHGALLSNLGALDADVVFIKTVDNVAPDSGKSDTLLYKEVLGGVMLSLQKQCFELLEALDRTPGDRELIDRAERFIGTELSYKLPAGFGELPPAEQISRLRTLLDRPIRVCGMVRNEGEPGGGPFWCIEADSSQTLQIVEAAQIAPEQKELIARSTHFNPVDLACGLKNYRGEKFDLSRFVDPDTGLISTKSKDGRELKAQELPGLWNGAMSRWNTVFVEVPLTTFSPVKIINDLLRPQHQE